MASFTFLQHLVPDPNVEKLLLGLAVSAGMVGLGLIARGRLCAAGSLQLSPEKIRGEIVPKSSITPFGLLDFFFDTWVKFQDGIIGKAGRRHAPFTATIFLFVLLANLLGLIPGFAATTTTVWINVGMALVVFGYFNAVGVKEQGLGGYLKHFAGPVWWLGPFIFFLEILSTCLRVLTLNLRLYWNISADHIVLGVFTEIFPLGVPIPFYALGTFVAFMQAFVFSLLTMVYIKFASHDEGHGHHDEEHPRAEKLAH